MESLFARLAVKYPSAAQCAAALGLTRQAYCQAEKRRHLSERKAILAGNLLGISPSEALLINHAATNNATLPELNPTPDAINKTYENRPNNTNYANLRELKRIDYCQFFLNLKTAPGNSRFDRQPYPERCTNTQRTADI